MNSYCLLTNVYYPLKTVDYNFRTKECPTSQNCEVTRSRKCRVATFSVWTRDILSVCTNCFRPPFGYITKQDTEFKIILCSSSPWQETAPSWNRIRGTKTQVVDANAALPPNRAIYRRLSSRKCYQGVDSNLDHIS